MLGFIFDTVLLEDTDGHFYGINLNNSLWEKRYLPIFGKMIVSTRYRQSRVIPDGYKRADSKDVEIIPLKSYKKVPDIFTNRRKIVKELITIINKCNYIIVRLPSPVGNMACDICKRLNKPYIIEMVACPWDGYRYYGNPIGKIVAPYMYFATRKRCREAKRVLYVTKHFLQERYPTNGKAIGISDVMIDNEGKKVIDNRLKKINSSGKKLTLGLVGNLNLASKGKIVALRALRILTKKYPNIKLELVGNGSSRKTQKQIKKLDLTTKNVVLRGSIKGGKNMYAWMDSIDILLIPSFQEGLPRVLVEAMSRGCPALGAKTGGIPELINSKYLHNPGDYHKLAKDIDVLLSSKELMSKLAIRNYNKAKEYYGSIIDAKRAEFMKGVLSNE